MSSSRVPSRNENGARVLLPMCVYASVTVSGYSEFMTRFVPKFFMFSPLFALSLACAPRSDAAGSPGAAWTFAVSGDSRNCGDFVMPVIASRVKAEDDAFYWHLGDFRWMSQPDEDLVAMRGAGHPLTVDEYRQIAWDDFLSHQMASFGDFPVFLGRGNHETVAPMTRDRYIAKFSGYLNRPEIVAQDRLDGAAASPLSSPWYHVVRDGVDFLTMDNASHDEFSDAQMTWLRGVLDRDLAEGSGVKTIVAGMHEALPNSTSSNHAMDDKGHGTESGEKAYRWFAAAQAAGKHVYLLASHSHFYSPDIYNSPEWRKAGIVVPGVIIGSAGAHRYLLPKTVDPRSKTHVYGYLEATVHEDGTIDFVLKEISEEEMMKHKWPDAPAATIHACFVGNSD
jgi:hypothetical protein